ncbi:hypothetical protein AAU57_12020 [Nonlabens sp. YIK11]|uniref:terminase small subunit-like protein n=1 Tax=Nonlabens sp. YIK11 TaxID=1453349 RepID=UPI0007079834|nr:hypothetical protein [Nonlabens sp. YIK11]KQC33974.1 hypothetical protein AAU57_12020 [Nonlabens sp. YIK11]
MAAPYTDEEKTAFVEQIITLITQGSSISKACKEVGIATSSYMLWLSRSEQYARDHARAMESRADVIFEEIIEIADSTENDIITNEEGREITNHNVIQRDRLRVDARKWVAAKMNPKKYSDKYSVDHTTKGESISQVTRTIVDPHGT